jgi:hypothetical protein
MQYNNESRDKRSSNYNGGSFSRRSQWPRGLRHEPSSPARTLESWIRIQMQIWTFVCVYSVFVLFCVYVAALRRDDPPSKEYYRV